ncbi:hypothetical protein CGCTS75_v013069 [Colletotrichum tropicale]|nr:hypothetical protein CGCTS75_v013069 [Colletotrichum tropicale]
MGIPYHPDLASLRQASINGCVLCQAIEKEVDALLEEIKTLEHPNLGAYKWVPDWNMWLTQRGESGGDGFWVVCSSVEDEGRYCLMPVASIGFASDEDDPLSVGSSDRVLKEVPNQSTLNLILKWLKACDDHPRCKAQHARMPNRLLDVGTLDSGSIIKLVQPDSDLCNPYVTLSYCWGKGEKHFITTSETIQARRDGIDINQLPQTLRDAVTLTRMVGVRYLWIDSLCICQDDLKDWERESAQMAAVYSNSYLTLAAVKSGDTNGGLLSARTPHTYFKLPRKGSSPDEYILATALTLDHDNVHQFHMRMKKEPLTKRAWGFQERVLARRILHFSSQQMYWECLEGFEAEQGLKLNYRIPFINDDTQLVEYVDQRRNNAHPTNPRWEGLDHSSTLTRGWHELLWEYGPRELTNPLDKLPAFSGIAKSLSKGFKDEYLAGLWRGSLIEGLCWQGLRCKPIEQYRAPSWSWASVDGIPATGLLGVTEEVANILEARVEIDGDNPFGRVKDGWIKLEAPLVKMSLSDAKGPTGHMLFRSEEGSDDCFGMLDTINRSYEASAELIRSMEVYALILAYTYGGPGRPDSERKNPCAHGIYVTPAMDRPGCMRRIGAVLQDVKDFSADELASSRITVTIV